MSLSGFSIEWLNQREDADRRARNSLLLSKATDWLNACQQQGQTPLIADMGAGTGSTLSAFADATASPLVWHWRLLDNDPVLLNEAQSRHGKDHDIELSRVDLSETGSLPLGGAHLVTASALFDLVSANFIDELSRSGIGV